MAATASAPAGPFLSARLASSNAISVVTLSLSWDAARRFSPAGIWSLLLLRDGFRGRADLLEISGDCRAILIVQLAGHLRHFFGTALAEAAAPHLQLESRVMRVLPGKVRDSGRFPGATRPVTIVAGCEVLRGIAHGGELFTPFDERRVRR